MTDTDTLREMSGRGDRARTLLENELLTDAFDAVAKAAHDSWEHSPDEEVQKRAWWLLQAAKQVRKQIETHIAHGKLADAEIEQISK